MRVLFQPRGPVQGRGRLEPLLEAQGAALDRTPFHPRATHTHTHSDWDSADTATHVTCTSLGYRRKWGSPEKNHTHGENVQTPDSGPGKELIFFLHHQH